MLPFYTAGHTRNVVVGDNGNTVVAWITLDVELIPTVVWPPLYYDYSQIGNSLGMNPLDKFYNADGTTFNDPNEVRIIGYDVGNARHILNRAVAIPVGKQLYYGYTNKIHLDPQVGQNPYYGVAPDPRAINNSGSTFVEYPNNYIVSAYPVSGIPYYKMNKPAIIGTMLPAVAGSGGRNQLLTYTIPQQYYYSNTTKCEVLLDLEFLEKVPIPRQIQNQQYYFWNSTDFNELRNIDVLFPVDEIQVVNSNFLTSSNQFNVYGFSSDLVQSSTLTNENYLGFNVFQSGIYQVNKKKFKYNQPRIINGGYKINAKYMLSGDDVDYPSIDGEFYFHLLFIQYLK